MTRFLAIGDLHLGSGADYGREPGDRLHDQERVWARALELAVAHDVDAVLFAGDAFHRRRPTPSELCAFQRPLQAFRAEHDIEVCAIPGNHDVESASLPSALEVFRREVDLYDLPGLWIAPGGAIVATLPWTPPARLVAARDGGDRDENHALAAQLLVETARDLRGQIDGPAVLLAHWSISGARTPTGVYTDDFREPVIPLADLEALGFDAVIAGHIHLPEVLNGPFDGGRPILYVGSPAPVDFGEQDSPHGCWIIDVGVTVTATFVPIPSRPFVTVGLSIDDVLGYSLDSDEDVTDAVVRVRYTATEEQARRIDHSSLTASLYEAGAHRVHSIQPTIVRENRARVEGVTEEIAPLAAVGAWCDANGIADRAPLGDLTSRYLQDVVA
jgi:DNA repair protein SbcD/Mre11